MFSRTPRTPAAAADDTAEERLDEVIGDYLEALEKGRAPSRTAFLAAHPDLASSLEAFLDDQDQFDVLISPLVGRRSSTPCRRVDGPSRVGERVGPYELLEELGRGGMGVVYRARHRQLGRVVALKMIRSDQAAAADEVQRFRLEAAAVARLDHPNIVPLYEVDEHEGRPYFAMKLVDGPSLAQAIARRGKAGHDQHDAARLLATVARAVHHAHQRGLLHRDLKPANILLASGGVGQAVPDGSARQAQPDLPKPLADATPLVTDFGLAKLLTAEQATGPLTQTGAAVGTPSYMAPEQALASGDVTTAVDVYSLGAILYEVLTGRPPFSLSSGLATLIEALERDPDPPRSLRPDLHRDLETICLKCLQKEPGKRYATAGELADDLDRYLRGEPIRARPVGRLERGLRWVRRNPGTASLAAAVVLSVVVGMGLVVWQWREAERQRAVAEHHSAEADRQRAEAERQKGVAEQQSAEAEHQRAEAVRQRDRAHDNFRDAHQVVNTFCFDLSEQHLSQIPGLEPLRKKVLEGGVQYYQRFLARKETDRRLRADEADAHMRIAHLNGAMGDEKAALDSLRKALPLYRHVLAENPCSRPWSIQVARALTNMANHLGALGQPEEQRDTLAEARDILEKLDGEQPADTEVQEALASVYNNEAGRRRSLGKVEDALGLARQAEALWRELGRRFPKKSHYRGELARVQMNLGYYEHAAGRHDVAEREWDQAHKALEKLSAERDGLAWKRELAELTRHLAGGHYRRGRIPEATALFNKSRAFYEDLSRASPKSVDNQSGLASVHSDLGGLYRDMGKEPEALESHRKALFIREKLATDHPGVNDFDLALAQSFHNIGHLHHQAKRPSVAAREYGRAIDVFRRLVLRNPDNVDFLGYLAGTLNNLADVQQSLRRFDEAIGSFEEGLRHQRKAVSQAPGIQHQRRTLSRLLHNLARAYRLAERPAEAVRLTLERRLLYPDDYAAQYDVARDLALALPLITDDPAEHERVARLTVETLNRAVDTGFRNKARFDEAEWKPLRNRDDFAKLMDRFTRDS